ncbi:MAG TPA: hypothetical protein VMZ49_07235 [Patescibacteria group bacterium]|nr:hypothetical protein [Patescibacteria group bacterium]
MIGTPDKKGIPGGHGGTIPMDPMPRFGSFGHWTLVLGIIFVESLQCCSVEVKAAIKQCRKIALSFQLFNISTFSFSTSNIEPRTMFSSYRFEMKAVLW